MSGAIVPSGVTRREGRLHGCNFAALADLEIADVGVTSLFYTFLRHWIPFLRPACATS
jgi:hypothetical protein